MPTDKRRCRSRLGLWWSGHKVRLLWSPVEGYSGECDCGYEFSAAELHGMAGFGDLLS